ncbi:DUF4350 domain-containing protein [Paenibacillus sp. CGMCC 1.16610]|uniref:DUF4350 domain-containing protein n=1 Tax=Paenibacillus anseongense TaxID=2682845 RepID=A0ABW9UGS0_9BACL|nr:MULTISPECIES: DUF4350 domain-containing protein [Paenibacillus]MBA2942003.1 DUF4350 domain-containing protein [Paenibacillus sp. CGMCC 1.16610]MVQ38519.1 hypothetical protein [Paenibacillus anseongense]
MTKGLNKLHVGLAVSIVLFFALGYWVAKPKLPDLPPYLSFSADVDGTKAWKELLTTKQSAVKEWRLDWKHLPGGTSMLLVAIQPSAVTKSDREHLLKWVQAGNDAIIFDREPQGWASWGTVRVDGGALGTRDAVGEQEQQVQQEKQEKQVKQENQENQENQEKQVKQVKDASTIRVSADYTSVEGTLTGKVETSYRLQPGGSGLALFEDERGVLASRVQEGAGSITMVLTPTWLQNGTIDEASHFELIWPLFAKSWDAVWVDETHHGYGTKPGLLAVYPAWLVLASAQLGLALLLWLWLRGKRFGPVHTPRAWTVRRGDEGVHAVAAWYERLGYRREALAQQQLFLRQLLYQRWGLSPSASALQAAEAARGRMPEAQAAQLMRLLAEPPAESCGVSTTAFVQRTREMGEMIAYLEKE